MSSISTAPTLLLGIECGGTRSVAILTDGGAQLVRRHEAGPANLRLLSDAQLVSHFQALAQCFPVPSAVGIGMAGVREESDRRRVREAAAIVWPGVPCRAANDLETSLAAADVPGEVPPPTRVIIISGTGSCTYGRGPTGGTAKVGGWGHLLGDRGSGYDIVLRALREILRRFDETGVWPALGTRLLRALLLNEPNDLVTWIHQAAKDEIAALAVEVFAAADAEDRVAVLSIRRAAESLVEDALCCARRLTKPGAPIEFVLVGGVLLKQPSFAGSVARQLHRDWKRCAVKLLPREGAWGAVALAAEEQRCSTSAIAQLGRATRAVTGSADPTAPAEIQIPIPTRPSPTEQRNPRSLDLDKRSLRSAIDLMLEEDAGISAALRAERPKIERAIQVVVHAFQQGGRLFYVGAGTSGRLGVLDASECPPTFGTPSQMVQGVIAGGYTALWDSHEGGEDDAVAGGRAMEFRGVGSSDVVVGIAASGRTPFVWGALHAAQRLKAATILLCFNPHLEIPRSCRPTVVISPDLGPEVLTGSTRLKAGTGTKLILNMITTLAMVRLGKVVSNLMVDLNPTNSKLRDRAVRITRDLTGVEASQAQAALEQAGWVVTKAIERLGSRSQDHAR